LALLVSRSLKYSRLPAPVVSIAREPLPGAPLVSAIIATYNWSSVLKFAVRSVLWQTEQNFEILIVGDGCTDDSAAVANSFGDARICWHNLPSNSGHQSAPDNAGLAMARGEYIAYLSHDDVWHPEHLRTPLAAITRRQADLASSHVQMIGPQGTNSHVVTGFYPSKATMTLAACRRPV
jgi:glycosyltransferase involved in cell wall biosynthesis